MLFNVFKACCFLPFTDHRVSSKVNNGRKSGWSKAQTSTGDSTRNAFKLRPMLSSDHDSDDNYKTGETIPLRKQDSRNSDDCSAVKKHDPVACSLSDSVSNEHEKTALFNHDRKHLTQEECL